MEYAVLPFHPFVSYKKRRRTLLVQAEKNESRGLIKVIFNMARSAVHVSLYEKMKRKDSFIEFSDLLSFSSVAVFGNAQPSKMGEKSDYDYSDWDPLNEELPPPREVGFARYKFRPVYYPSSDPRTGDAVHLWSQGRSKNDSGFHFALEWEDFMVSPTSFLSPNYLNLISSTFFH